jgi:hypothetical protein
MADTKRIKIATGAIEGSVLTLRCYDAPHDDGSNQTVIETLVYDVAELPVPVQAQLCALGLNRQIEQRYNRGGDTFPAVPAIAARVWASMKDGTWQLGRVASESEPSDLELALAEVTNTPIHVVQQRFEEDVVRYPTGHPHEGEPILDAKGRTRRYFDKQMQARLAEQPRVKLVLARLAQERAKRLAAEAKGKTGTTDLDALFPGERTAPAEAAE